MEKKQKFTLGFIFNKDLNKVLLIKKNRAPKGTEMTGKLNGIGGHLEQGEYPHIGMFRECEEETGLKIDDWTLFCELDAKFGYVYCFYAVTDDIFNFKQVEDEELNIYDIYPFNNVWTGNVDTTIVNEKYYKNYNRMNNIDWLIEMALNNRCKLDSCSVFEIKEIY